MKPTVQQLFFKLAATSALASAVAHASAQVNEAADEKAQNEDILALFEEIIVTAERREENVLDIPLAITALSVDMLEKRGITSAQDLQYSVPGLTIGETTVGTAQVSIRGIGTENNSAGGDPGVPLHIDGHYIQFSSYILQDFFDIERVEVQRGPQGTFYGRNAVGGNIDIITKRPTEEFEGELSLGLGNYDKRQLQGVVSGALTDSMRGRVALSSEKRDGFVENITTGDDLLDSDYTTVRASLEYDLTEDFQALLSSYRYEDDSASFIARMAGEYPSLGYYAFLPPGYSNVSASDPGKIRADSPHRGSEDAEGTSLDLSWQLDSVTLKSLSAYNDARKYSTYDADGTDLPFSAVDILLGSRTFTQEFQLLSNTVGKLDWILGLFYFEESSDYSFTFTVPNTPVVFHTPAEVKTESIAVFGQLDYSLSEMLELTIGLRHTRDEKDMHRSIQLTTGNVANDIDVASVLDDSWEQTSGKIGLNYMIAPNVLLYGLYSLGFKAGGFNPTSVTEAAYDPELLDAYEIGMKGRFFQERLQLSTSAFYYDYTDKVESIVDIPPGETVATVIFTNAAAATIMGVDLELQAFLTKSFLIDASIGYMDSEYDKFISNDPQFDAPDIDRDLSGNQLTRTPEWKFHIGAQYLWQLGGGLGTLISRVDYSWVDEQYFRAFNLETDRADSYHRTNARLQWYSNDAHWEAQLYVLNLEDDYAQSNLTLSGPDLGFAHVASYFPPRTYGLKVNYSF